MLNYQRVHIPDSPGHRGHQGHQGHQGHHTSNVVAVRVLGRFAAVSSACLPGRKKPVSPWEICGPWRCRFRWEINWGMFQLAMFDDRVDYSMVS